VKFGRSTLDGLSIACKLKVPMAAMLE